MSTKETKKSAHTEPAATPDGAPPDAHGAVAITSVANAATPRKKVDVQAAWGALVAGILAHYTPAEAFRLPSGPLKRDQVVSTLRRFIAAAEVTKERHKAYLAAVQSERQVLAELRPIHKSVVTIIRGEYGSTSRTLMDFGLAPEKSRRKSPGSKFVAGERLRATREARGTRGRKQRARIHGTLAPDSPAHAVLGSLHSDDAAPAATPSKVPSPAAAVPATPVAGGAGGGTEKGSS